MAHPDLRHPFKKKPINSGSGATVLAAGKTIQIAATGGGEGLLVSPADLTRVNGFELKPEGACLGSLCLPIKPDSGILKNEADQQWINLLAFADFIGQPYVGDDELRVWSFGPVPEQRSGMMMDAQAPEFEVIGRSGEVVRMADFKGKKALIITWSSW